MDYEYWASSTTFTLRVEVHLMNSCGVLDINVTRFMEHN